jgi:hypothetical protein
MAHCPLQLSMTWGVLPPVQSVIVSAQVAGKPIPKEAIEHIGPESLGHSFAHHYPPLDIPFCM